MKPSKCLIIHTKTLQHSIAPYFPNKMVNLLFNNFEKSDQQVHNYKGRK